MTTETAPDPIVHDWSNNLEEELLETGMDQPQARAFARAFEMGMTRVMSVVATKQDLLLTKQDLQREIDNLRREMRFNFLLLAGLVGAMFAGIFAVLGVILSKL